MGNFPAILTFSKTKPPARSACQRKLHSISELHYEESCFVEMKIKNVVQAKVVDLTSATTNQKYSQVQFINNSTLDVKSPTIQCFGGHDVSKKNYEINSIQYRDSSSANHTESSDDSSKLSVTHRSCQDEYSPHSNSFISNPNRLADGKTTLPKKLLIDSLNNEDDSVDHPDPYDNDDHLIKKSGSPTKSFFDHSVFCFKGQEDCHQLQSREESNSSLSDVATVRFSSPKTEFQALLEDCGNNNCNPLPDISVAGDSLEYNEIFIIDPEDIECVDEYNDMEGYFSDDYPLEHSNQVTVDDEYLPFIDDDLDDEEFYNKFCNMNIESELHSNDCVDDVDENDDERALLVKCSIHSNTKGATDSQVEDTLAASTSEAQSCNCVPYLRRSVGGDGLSANGEATATDCDALLDSALLEDNVGDDLPCADHCLSGGGLQTQLLKVSVSRSPVRFLRSVMQCLGAQLG